MEKYKINSLFIIKSPLRPGGESGISFGQSYKIIQSIPKMEFKDSNCLMAFQALTNYNLEKLWFFCYLKFLEHPNDQQNKFHRPHTPEGFMLIK